MEVKSEPVYKGIRQHIFSSGLTNKQPLKCNRNIHSANHGISFISKIFMRYVFKMASAIHCEKIFAMLLSDASHKTKKYGVVPYLKWTTLLLLKI